MFTIDQNITDFNIKEKSIVKLLFSMNVHSVATPEMSLEEARSYVVFCREGQKRISAYIGLYFLNTDRRLFYTFATNPFPDGELPDVENEARNFAEGLGAMLDEIDFAKMSDLDKDNWIEDQPIFGQKKQAKTEPSAPPAAEVQAAPAQPASVEQPAPAPQVAPVVPEMPPATPAQPVPPASAPQSASVPHAPAAEPVQPVVPTPPVFPDPVVQPQSSAPPVPEVPPASPEDDVQDEPTVATPSQTNVHPSSGASPLAAAAKKRQEIMQKAIKSGVVKAPKQSSKKETPSLSGVVARDREALARLFTSF